MTQQIPQLNKLYFFEIQDQIQNHFIAAYTKEQAATIYIRKFQSDGDIEVEFLTFSAFTGLQEGSIPTERIQKLKLEELGIEKPGYINKELIMKNLTNIKSLN